MSRTFHTAASAFEETLERLELTVPESQLKDSVELGYRAALLAAANALWERHLGPLLEGQDVRELLRVKTRQAVSDLAKRGRLLALPTEQGELRFPAFQFMETGRPHPELPRILEMFNKASVSPYTIASWFSTPQILLKGKTPAWWLKAGRDPEPVKEVARRTAARLRR